MVITHTAVHYSTCVLMHLTVIACTLVSPLHWDSLLGQLSGFLWTYWLPLPVISSLNMTYHQRMIVKHQDKNVETYLSLVHQTTWNSEQSRPLARHMTRSSEQISSLNVTWQRPRNRSCPWTSHDNDLGADLVLAHHMTWSSEHILSNDKDVATDLDLASYMTRISEQILTLYVIPKLLFDGLVSC